MDQQERDGQQPSQALSTRQEFGGSSMVLANTETSSTAVAAQAQAAIQARYIMALRKPRSWDEVRVRLVGECRRPGFAAVARYRKPIGKGVEGLSIRFVEAALRCMTNVLPEVMAIYDDIAKKIVRVTVTDLENNITYSQDITINKTVERSKPMDDGSYISVRKNSWGKETFTVPATDDDLLNKEGALISKAMRTLGLRLIPGDIQDECEALIIKTAADKAAKDPDGERKALTDAFATLGVTPRQLESYLGQPLNQLTPHQLVELRGLYAALRDGEATWKSVMENKAAQEGGNAGEEAAKQSSSAPATNAAGVKQPRSKKEAEAATGQQQAEQKKAEPATSQEPPPNFPDGVAQAQGVDPETGEMFTEPESEQAVAAALSNARSLQELDAAADRVQNVTGEGAVERLGAIYHKRTAQIKEQHQQQQTTATVQPSSPPATDGYIKMVMAKAANATITEVEIFKRFNMQSWAGATVSRCNEILKWIANPS